MMNKLIALIDGSVYSQSVCDHGAWIAKRAGVSIELLHVLGRDDVSSEPANLSGSIGLGARTALLDELAELDAQKAKLAQKRGRAILLGAKTRIEEAGVSDVSTRLRHAEIVETVLEFEKDALFVVVGKRGEGADFDQLHLGSNLERVVRSSHRPVFVAARSFQPIHKMLIAFDGGASAMKAVEYVASSKVFNGITCQLLAVGDDTIERRRQLEGAAAMLREQGYSTEIDIQDGQVDEIITNKIETDGIDLLLMGAYGHSQIRNLIIDSTTTEMIRSCMISVVLFR